MSAGKTVFYVLTALAAIIMLCWYLRSKKPARTAFFGMSSGAAALLAAHFWGSGLGLYLPLNIFTTAVSLILGAPGVLILAIINKFII